MPSAPGVVQARYNHLRQFSLHRIKEPDKKNRGEKKETLLPGTFITMITYRKVAGLSAVVAAAAGAGAAQAQGRAVGLNMAKTLAVVALLGLRAAGKRAAVGLMA